jgi:hypothetical protein
MGEWLVTFELTNPFLMKKLVCILLFCAGGSIANAQRNCGTMANLQLLQQQDPNTLARHAGYEADIQQWIRQHAPVRTAVVFPQLPGFRETGDPITDREAYARAKAALYADTAAYRQWKQSASPVGTGERRSRPNCFLTIENPSNSGK